MTSATPQTPDRRNESIASLMAFVERYVLSLIYYYLAGRILVAAVQHGFGWTSSGGMVQPTFPDAATDVLLFVMQFFVATMLLFSKRPAPEAPTLREIFVPLATAFFFVAYDLVPSFPAFMQVNQRPTVWPSNLLQLHPYDALGLLFGLIGPLISIWGVVTLRRSFAIFVSVREIVLRGPYKYVRHPIYLGYIFSYGGLVLLTRSYAFALLASIHLCLFVWRARLEEAKLAAHSPEYRENMKRAGFLFPRIFRRS